MISKIARVFLFSLTCLCLVKPALAQTVSLPGGLPIPSLEDERNTYRRWGWAWTASDEPNYPSDTTYTVSDPDLHGDTEGDDLWSYLMMYRRTSQQGYQRRAEQWARYFRDDYRQCVGSSTFTYCYDDANFLLDHFYGWGLVGYYEFTGNATYLAAAENLAVDSESWATGVTVGSTRLAYYGIRKWARHLLVAARVAEANPISRWITLRDKLVNAWLQSPDWQTNAIPGQVGGMYFYGDFDTNNVMGSGQWQAGSRMVSAFMVGILAEAFFQVYRTTGRADVRARLVAMADFVNTYGLDPTYQYTGAFFGFKNGAVWHNYSNQGSTSFWDPVYTTDVVNTLVLGYKMTGNTTYYDRAKYFFNRGTKGVYGSSTQRAAPDNEVHHFVDSRFGPGFSPNPSGNFHLAYNKGELQYTYLLFENGGLPSTDTTPPAPPTRLEIR